MVLQEKLAERKLPELLKFADGSPVTEERWEERRREMLDLLCDEEYGHAPKGPFTVTSEVTRFAALDQRAYAGKALTKEIRITVKAPDGEFSFPIEQVIPKSDKKLPVIIFINFRPEAPDRYWPVEEVIDRGVAVFRIYYNDVAKDANDEFKSGLGLAFDHEKYDWGKISMWAWAASRTLDYVETLEGMDLDNVAVLGHSRLGKTALFCAANDERFKYSFVNCSGCSGDAITRQKTGEHVVNIYKSFPVWFCPNYAKYRDNEDDMPFDQHFLVACCAPRFICSSTAIEDTWADPFSQFLSDYAASEAWTLLGLKGLVTPDRMPVPGDVYLDGSVGFQLRSGAHFLSRADWNFYLDFMEKKMAEGK